jgi:hypothetical protein
MKKELKEGVTTKVHRGRSDGCGIVVYSVSLRLGLRACLGCVSVMGCIGWCKTDCAGRTGVALSAPPSHGRVRTQTSARERG